MSAFAPHPDPQAQPPRPLDQLGLCDLLSAEGYLEACYRTLLGRAPEAPGFETLRTLAASLSRREMLRYFLESEEFKARFLNDASIRLPLLETVEKLGGVAFSPGERLTLDLPAMRLPMLGRDYTIYDYPNYRTSRLVLREIMEDDYALEGLALPERPVIVDVGASIGLFTLAGLHRWPGARVISFEPVPTTFGMLEANLGSNGLAADIHNIGLSGDGRPLTIQFDPWGNAAAASAVYTQAIPFYATVTAPTRRLSEVLDELGVSRIDLLKIDCEGLEYEIFEDMGELRDRVGHLRVELHKSKRLTAEGRTPEPLIKRLNEELGPTRFRYVVADKDAEEAAALS